MTHLLTHDQRPASRAPVDTTDPVNNQMTGNEARAIRRHLGLSAPQVARFVGTNESSIYRWEWRKDQFVPPMYALALRYMLEWPRRHRDYPHHSRFPRPTSTH